MEENFASVGKLKGKGEHSDRRRGKEEANSSGQARDAHEHKMDAMNQLIRNLSNKLVKLRVGEQKTSSIDTTRSQ